MNDHVIQLTAQQFKYLSRCVAYGLNCFPPWPDRERQEQLFSELFMLEQNKFGAFEECGYFGEDD